MSLKQRKHKFKLFTQARVEDWLGQKLGGKIIRLTTVNGGVVFIDNSNEQLRLMFPNIAIDAKNPAVVLGLVLDQEKGWFLCAFKYSKDTQKVGVLKSIIREIGYKYKYPITALLYKTLRNNTELDSIKDFMYSVNLLLKWTYELKSQ